MGGAEHYLMMLLKHLDRTQFTLHLALTNPALAEKATALKVPIHYVHLPRLRDSAQAELEWMKGAWVLAQLARRLGAAVLVGNTIRSSFFCALAAQIVRCSFVWYMHDFWLSESHPRYRQLDQFQKRFLCATATRVIAISHAVFHHIPCRQKTVVIHNGLDLTSYTPQPQGNDFRRIWQIPENVPVIGMVGRLRPWKGQARFLRAMVDVRARFPTARFLVVGGANFETNDAQDYPAQLKKLVHELNLDSHVIFTDHLSDVRPALSAMDVFVHPGDPEPFGLVNIEAMAVGKPVIAFAHGALPEIVIDRQTGLLVSPNDEAALAEAVMVLLNHPQQIPIMGQAGRKVVEVRFEMNRVAQEVATILNDAANLKPPRGMM
jgi:glycosyltransferase involved in cell wall biosynthesis